MRKSVNPSNGDEINSPRQEAYEENRPPSIYNRARSEITDFSSDGFGGAQSEITELTYTSSAPLATPFPPGRFESYQIPTTISTKPPQEPAMLSVTTRFKPTMHFLERIKDRLRFLWDLFKLNYRMLISLSLTLIVAIFVSSHEIRLILDLCELNSIPKVHN